MAPARFNHMRSLRDVPEHVLREITNFFEVMTELYVSYMALDYLHGIYLRWYEVCEMYRSRKRI